MRKSILAALAAVFFTASQASATLYTSGGSSFSAISSASVTRPANTTSYTSGSGVAVAWNNSSPTYLTFSNVCRTAGGQVLIPQVDLSSTANPTVKLGGVLYLFAGTPTAIADNVSFALSTTNFAKLTGSIHGIPFNLVNTQGSAAPNSGVSMVNGSYHAQCAAGTTTIYGMVSVVGGYNPASGEVLTVTLHTLGTN